ncbi:MAG: hypothetical protein ABSD39_22180 [Terriglobales bacterium]|jgi:hypothetical protein
MDVHRVLVRLSAKFVRAQMVALTVRDSGCGVSVRGEVVEFCNSIMRTLWHGVLPWLHGQRIHCMRAMQFTRCC